jgi:hypothetical protein
MTGNLSGFNATEVEREEVRSFEILPPGSYRVAILDAPMRDTKKGDGRYLAAKLQILEGKYQNRYLWDNITMSNPNPTAVKIGKQRLAEICEAVEIPQPDDSSELCHKPLVAVVGQRKRRETDEMQNIIRQYLPASGKPVEEAPPW